MGTGGDYGFWAFMVAMIVIGGVAGITLWNLIGWLFSHVTIGVAP